MPVFELQRLYIGGVYVDATSGETFDTLDPATGETLASVQQASAADIDRAVRSAREGQREWAAMTAMQRSRILRRAVDILRERNDELAELETRDTGKPIAETRAVDIVTGADVIEVLRRARNGHRRSANPAAREFVRLYATRTARRMRGHWRMELSDPDRLLEVRPRARRRQRDDLQAQRNHAAQHVETPLKSIPKPAFPQACSTSCRATAAWGALLAAHPDIAKISFTGGVETGKKVMSMAGGSSLKEVTMELGGKSPLVIFDDANLERAADIAMSANFFSSGQVCTNGTRVFVQRPVYERFEALLLERVKRIRVGSPTDANTNFGPLVSAAQLHKVLGFIESGKQEGARLIAGGSRIVHDAFAQGQYVEPTIFTDCRDDMRIVREEIFGPGHEHPHI